MTIDFAELLEYTQGQNNAENHKPQEIKGVSDAYNSINLSEFTKKDTITYTQNYAVYDKPQENGIVHDVYCESCGQVTATRTYKEHHICESDACKLTIDNSE